MGLGYGRRMYGYFLGFYYAFGAPAGNQKTNAGGFAKALNHAHRKGPTLARYLAGASPGNDEPIGLSDISLYRHQRQRGGSARHSYDRARNAVGFGAAHSRRFGVSRHPNCAGRAPA